MKASVALQDRAAPSALAELPEGLGGTTKMGSVMGLLPPMRKKGGTPPQFVQTLRRYHTVHCKFFSIGAIEPGQFSPTSQ